MTQTEAPTTPVTPETPPETPPPDETSDLAGEVEKWKALAQKHEKRAKDNVAAVKELEELRTASMSDQEKAVAQAKAEARIEAFKEVGAKLVDAEIRAAATGRNVDVDALLEGLDRSRFIDDDGDAKRAEIVAWVDRVAPEPEPQDDTFMADFGQGVRTPDQRALNGDPLLRDIKAKLGVK